VSVLPDEPARLREDATLPLLDVHSTRLLLNWCTLAWSFEEREGGR
jgi:hypothetical protein